MNFQNPYSRSDYQNFFQNQFLTDDFKITEEKLSFEFTPQYSKEALLIGEDKSLELKVIEVLHESENDPRVGLSRDIFRLMRSYGYRRALVLLHSSKSQNYRLSLATIEFSLEGSKVKKEYSNPRRYSFFLGPNAKVKTPYEFLVTKGRVKDFEDLQSRFSIEVVNKEFYKEIANWYFWAIKEAKFPDDAESEKNGREISVIRLITRLIFIWFMKVRKLVPEDLFNEVELKKILTDLKQNNDNYYKAILQNLFFATLNTKQEERRFTSKKKGYKGFSQDFGNHNVYRYEELFKDSEEVIEKYFMPIPFLNGGLFECLDYKSKTKDERKYIDGFTSTKSKQPSVPNYLFFSEDRSINLNKDYGTSNKNYNVRGLIKTLSLYNFTIDESDPNDADVALDPELLGKVFENLLASYNPETANTARKSTGSYYTPRPIVDYMVDESLKQYFKTHLGINDIDNKLNILFSGEDQTNPFNTDETKKLVALIDSLRVVDPAVGSGAFPMRILNRLVFLLHKLDPDNSLWKQSQIEGIKKSVKDVTLQRRFIEETERKFKEKNPDYGRKLYLIEKCIYGVDIQQIAVEIAKLRFFISLLVDEKVENGEIEPLPNLDFKLMQGNSLISSFAGIDFSMNSENEDNLFDFDERYKQLINEFEELKSQYQNEPDVHKKRKLRDEIDAKLLEIFEEKLKQHYPQFKEIESKYGGRKEIIESEKKKLFKKIGIDLDQAEQDLIAYTEGRKQKDFFLWDVYFAEVFAEKGGFDIAIGNPPYVLLQEKVRNDLQLEYFRKSYNVASYKVDLYHLFYEKSITIMNQRGVLSFISPSNFLSNNYTNSLRRFLLSRTELIRIINIDSKVFEAEVNNAVIICQVNSDKNKKACFYSASNIENFVPQKLYDLSQREIIKDKDCLLVPLTDIGFLSISKKIEATSKPLSDFAFVKFGMQLRNRKKFTSDVLESPSKSQLTKFHKKCFTGSDISNYVVTYNNLYCFFNIKAKRGGCWDEQFHFAKPKILVRQIGVTPIVGIETFGYPVLNSAFMIVCKNSANSYYLLGLLNSRLLQFYWLNKFGDKREQFPKIKGGYLELLPIKFSTESINEKLLKLVVKIVNAKQQNPSADTKHLEDQIDIMVYKLYNLTYEEVKIIDPEIEKIISKEDYERFEIK